MGWLAARHQRALRVVAGRGTVLARISRQPQLRAFSRTHVALLQCYHVGPVLQQICAQFCVTGAKRVHVPLQHSGHLRLRAAAPSHGGARGADVPAQPGRTGDAGESPQAATPPGCEARASGPPAAAVDSIVLVSAAQMLPGCCRELPGLCSAAGPPLHVGCCRRCCPGAAAS